MDESLTVLQDTIFNKSPYGQVVLDDQKKIHLANHTVCKMFHVSYSAVEGLDFGFAFNCCALRQGSSCGECNSCKSCLLYKQLSKNKSETKGRIFRYKYRDSWKVKYKWFELSVTPFVIKNIRSLHYVMRHLLSNKIMT